MRWMIPLLVLLCAAPVLADSTYFANTLTPMGEIVMSEDLLRDSTWSYYRSGYIDPQNDASRQENQRIVMAIRDVRDSIGAGATLTQVVCSVKVAYIDSTGNVGVVRQFKPYVDHQMSLNYWWSASGYNWGTAGANNASDAGSDNNTDGSGYDRMVSAYDTISVTATGWYVFNLDPDWEDANGDFKFQLMHLGTRVDVRIYNNHAPTTTDRPRVWAYYTASAASPGQIIMVE